MWNPAQAGEVFVTLGTMVAKGQPIKDGTNIPGLGVVHPDGHNLIVDQLVDLNEKTVDELAKSGL
jgi:simple sugar transport system substrate-binding protein